MDEVIRELADRTAILDLIHRYARAVDERDWDLFESCFADDAEVDYTAVGGIRGKLSVVKAWLAEVLSHFAVVQHMVTNIEIEFAGNEAFCRSYLFNPMGLVDDEGRTSFFFDGGIYRDRLTRTAGGWRIAERKIEPTFSTRYHTLLARTLPLNDE